MKPSPFNKRASDDCAYMYVTVRRNSWVVITDCFQIAQVWRPIVFTLFPTVMASWWSKIASARFSYPTYFWLTILSVVPLAHCVVSLSSVCRLFSVVCPSEKVSEGVNRKQGSKSSFFWVAAIFLLPVSPLRPPRRPFLPYFCPYSQAIGNRW